MMLSDQLPLNLGHRTALDREDFLVAENNALAVDWIDRWPDWSNGMLALYGPAGCGKSHLAQVWCTASGANMIEPLALPQSDLLQLLGPRSVVCCELDEDLLASDTAQQEGLLHLYNMVREQRGSLLLTARSAPARWSLTIADLRSRLVTVTAVELGPPDEALMAAVMAKLFNDRQLRVPPPVVHYLVQRMERSFAAARTLVEAIDAVALASRREITLPLAREVLARQPLDGESMQASPPGQ